MKLIKLSFLLIIICLSFLFFTFIKRCVTIITYPFDIDAGEGYILNESKVLALGGNIYKDINYPPYLCANYPPVYQFLTGLIMRIFNKFSFFIPRVTSFLCSITIMLLIFYIVFRYSKNFLISIISSLIFPAMWYAYEWSPYARVDLLGILFSILAYINVDNIPLCVLFSALAVYTKQTFVFAAVVCFSYLFLVNKIYARRLLVYYLLLCTLIALVLNLITKNQFVKHIIFTNAYNPYSIKRTLDWFNSFVGNYFMFTFLAIYQFLNEIKQKRPSVYAYFLLSSIIIAAGVGQIGAYVNYFLELSVAISILASFALANILEKKYNFVICILLLFQVIYLLKITPDFKLVRKHNWSKEPTIERLKTEQELYKFIMENKKKHILKETKVGMLVLADKEVEYHPHLFRVKKWNLENFIHDIKNGRYEIIIAEEKHFDYERFGFCLSKKIGGYCIYKYHK